MGRWAGIDRILMASGNVSPFVSQRLVTWVTREQPRGPRGSWHGAHRGRQGLTSVIDRSFDLSAAPEAIRFVEEGHTREAKVVITL